MGRPQLGTEVLRRVVARDPEALNTFFDHYFDRVYTHVTNLTGDPVLAEDLTQEAFIRLHRAIDRLDPARDPAGWVFTVVSNTVCDHWRSKQHRRSKREVDITKLEDFALTNGRPTPDREMERQQVAAAIREAVLSLAPNDREVLLLRSYEGLETSEIAQVLNIKPEAVRQRHSRALSRLGKAFRKNTERKRR
jgi:RNA polymerase sigma-70 factor (ECF subfamily)